ncbi:MAG TPA: FmdB family zinc ribbon protein [Chthoniobacterales bacterium]|jgi:putative FmdB family regulatory protein|nr:FmdB family zinc ribbon protein [Chthoniobacterales bacterium]
MPTYEYLCEKCGQTFEAFQSMKDEPLKICSKELCRQDRWGQGTVKRLLGRGAGLLFKGSGFYITDYRSSSYKESAKKESNSPSSESAKGGSAKGGSEKASGATGSSNKPSSSNS